MIRFEEGDPISVERGMDGAFWHVTLKGRRGNLVDLELLRSLERLFDVAAEDERLCSVLLTSAGEDFLLGADPAELAPGRVETFIPVFFDVVEKMLASSLFLIAAIRGKCLGAGLELISVFGRIYASPDARVGLPQLEKGLIAPVASVTLPERIGRPASLELCASGHIKRADEASWIGLVDHVVENPEQVARGEIEEYLVPLSASSVRLSIRALNLGPLERFRSQADGVQRLYLEELMKTADAVEGLRAGAEGRAPEWKHR